MNRKQFIQSHGATCQNWTWSWSFENTAERIIIFGAWDLYKEGNRTLILSEGWATSRRGRRQPGYPQSREHIRKIEEEGYSLKTFQMEYAPADEDDVGAPAKIKGFVPELRDKTLVRVENCWYACDPVVVIHFPDELAPNEVYREGAASTVTVNQYERNALARTKCLEHHGRRCAVCDFDFEQVYGEIGSGYIHVHHLVPLSEIGEDYEVDPIRDLVPICPNCHAMVHSTSPALSIKQLKQQIRNE